MSLRNLDNIFKLDTMRLFKYVNGYWYVSTKRGHSKSLKTKDKAIAQRIFHQLKREYLAGKILSLDKENAVTLKQFRSEYLEHREAIKKTPATIRLDGIALQKMIDHMGSNKVISMITRNDIDKFHRDILRLGTKATTLNVYMRHLKSAFVCAQEWGYIKINPYRTVKQIVTDTEYTRFLTQEEINKLLSVIDDIDFKRFVIFAILTGCRSGELLRLQWADVKDTHIIIRKTKTHTPRTVPIVEQLKTIIDEMRQPSGLVFPRWKTIWTVSKYFKKYVTKAGIPPIKLHGCRHTLGSHLAMSGVHQKTIAEILGHTQLSTTERYMHLHPDHLKDEMSKMKIAVNPHLIENPKIVSIGNKKR